MKLFCYLVERTLARHAAAGTELPDALARHLGQCAACRDCWAELALLTGQLGRALTLPAPPAHLTTNARQLLAESGLPARFHQPRWAAAAALLLVVGASAAFQLSHLQRRPATGSPGVALAPPVVAGMPPQLATASGGSFEGSFAVRDLPPGEIKPRETTEDTRYLNGEDPALQRYWLGHAASSELQRLWTAQLPPMRDDFVLPRPVLLASNGTAGVRQAAEEYAKEAAVVDARLFKKLTLALKGTSLEELCEKLRQETGVRFQAARIVADEKVTVFVDERPAREVMREVARLFGFMWARSGEPGAYRYELVQTLRAQLADEELRQQDQNGAVLALDARMQADAPLLDLPLEALKHKAKNGTEAERTRADLLLKGAWGGAQLFRRLPIADLLRLRSGQEVTYLAETDDPSRRLPPEWKPALLETGREVSLDPGTGKWTALTDFADARVSVHLRVDRSELGQWTLTAETGCYSATAGYGLGGTPRALAVGESPSVENPDNARGNTALRSKAPFTRRISLAPQSSRPALKQWHKPGETIGASFDEYGRNEAPAPQVMSDDVWEELHRKTGLPIVADYYTHLYDEAVLTHRNVPLFEALCRTGDTLGVRWKQDGEFLLARSTSFFWDKQKEVPARFLRRWAADREREGGLPLPGALEMATFSNAQLTSRVVGEGIVRGWGLAEWTISGGGSGPRPLRPVAEFLAGLAPGQLSQAASSAGLPLTGLTAEQQQRWLQLRPDAPKAPGARMRITYVPAGWYVWVPVVPQAEGAAAERLPITAGRTLEETLAAAERLRPGTPPSQIRRSTGVLAVSIAAPGSEMWWVGKPPTLALPGG